MNIDPVYRGASRIAASQRFQTVWLAVRQRIPKAENALPMGNLVDATMLVLSLEDGRIALAYTVPYRTENSFEGRQCLVCRMLDSLFP